MKGNTRMEKGMVKEHTLGMMEESMLGEYKDGLKNGQGTFTWNDGGKYVGEFKDGLKNGQGTYTWNDGGKYVGEYKDGKYHGQGTLHLHK